ncbi:hypothetical protein ACSCB1_39690 [Streptomyces europaeiscabiei]|uniref:Uncharacterized protein n=1 Tax=Streptomyces europaeiscabiei TaxID=146819 RepID=A0ABU4NNJ9_9ACTN|nr:hypothetical protein [Streptomyces europaeiscabiei]MDX2528525.1 hypothetical protein [Streptomyces europaeiscabiei]MDX2762280.1 hypothetical protein [Streptomyces europaeiscabiei]MDX2771343.1 hypothetical protein [Streptomyces europaeiscabiei]MDX3546268.1 hypothetical protein [Streptomyces europaeiscabiei]MDX3557426.1 hypothetical protein [Streptomyces europaeiscabiei]
MLDLLDDLGAIERDRGMADPGFTGSDPRVRWVVKVLAEQGIDPRTNEVAAVKALRAALPGLSLVAATALARETKLSQAV